MDKKVENILNDFSSYMQKCLYGDKGFYQEGLGKPAVTHFVTAVTTSMAFRKAIFHKLENFIEKNGDQINVVDLGSGNADLLFSLKKLCEDNYPNINWYAVDISSSALTSIEVLYPWINAIEKFDISDDRKNFIIANELFDNLLVDLELKDGCYYPVLIGAESIIKSLKEYKIEIIVADYFITKEKIQELGTSLPPKFIRAYKNQQLVTSWYLHDGQCDITVDVDKVQLIEIFHQNGFKLLEQQNQENFVEDAEDELFNHSLFEVLTFSNIE